MIVAHLCSRLRREFMMNIAGVSQSRMKHAGGAICVCTRVAQGQRCPADATGKITHCSAVITRTDRADGAVAMLSQIQRAMHLS
jgi:hypothetical protein